MATVQQFFPIVTVRRAPKIIAGMVGALLLVCALALGAVALGDAKVSYTFRSGVLTIHTGSLLDGERTFASSAVSDARIVQLTSSRRTFGTAAPGRCTGRWWHAETGPVWQATNCSRRALLLNVLSSEGKVAILISPPDLESFLARLSAPPDGHIELPLGDTRALRWLTGALAIALVLGNSLLVTTFLLAPKRLSYIVGDGEVVVRTLFRRRKWSTRDLSARAYGPAKPSRLMGASFPGYYAGLFNEQGRGLHVYATDLDRGVLLSGTQRVYLSPGNREAFLAALSAEGARIEG